MEEEDLSNQRLTTFLDTNPASNPVVDENLKEYFCNHRGITAIIKKLNNKKSSGHDKNFQLHDP